MKEKKSLDERIDEQNRTRQGRTDENLPGKTSLAVEQGPSETHNATSSPEGDDAGENKVWTGLNEG